MADESGVLVLGDSPGGELSPTARELLTAGRKAADDLGEELAIGLLGDTLDQPSQQAISYGADKVYGCFSAGDQQCEIIEGDDAADAGRQLALKLREAKLI